jgi:hypothetical protein
MNINCLKLCDHELETYSAALYEPANNGCSDVDISLSTILGAPPVTGKTVVPCSDRKNISEPFEEMEFANIVPRPGRYGCNTKSSVEKPEM